MVREEWGPGLRRNTEIVSNHCVEHAEYDLMDEAEAGMWWYRALHARLADALAGVTGRILDAGCGTGGLLARLPQTQGAVRFGLEYHPPAAARAAAKSGAPVAAGSICALPFADASFDAVVSADVLCHAGVDPQVALAELARVLRPGGRLVLNMPAYGWLMSAHDRRVHNTRRVDRGTLQDWLRTAGYGAARVFYWNSLLLPLMVVQRKLLARGEAASDVAAFPPWLDATFLGITEIERRLKLRLPAGGSVIAIAHTPQPVPTLPERPRNA
jgi:SAM-dependent methyltransferase